MAGNRGVESPERDGDPDGQRDTELAQITAERNNAIGQLLGAHTELAQYRSLVGDAAELSREGVLLASLATQTPAALFCNSAFLRITGLDGQQLGQHPESLGESLPAKWFSHMSNSLVDGQPAHQELHCERTNRWVEASSYPLPGHSVILVLHDITKFHRKVQRLDEQNRRLQVIASNSADLVLEILDDGSVGWISPASISLLGYPPKEVVGRPISDFVHPDDRAVTTNAITSAEPVVARLVRRDGQALWLAVRLRRASESTEAGLVASARLMSAQSEPAWAAHPLDFLLDPHVFLQPEFNKTGEIVDFTYLAANEAASRWLDRSRSDVVGRRFSEVHPDADPGRLRLYVDTVRTGRQIALDDVVDPQAVDPDGAPRVDLRIAKHGDGLSITWRDVSERYARLQELLRRESALDRAMELSPVAQALLSPDGAITQANPTFSELLGRHHRWLTDKELAELLMPSDGQIFSQDLARLTGAGPQSLARTYTFVSPEGRPLPTRVTLTSVFDHTEPVAVVCYADPADPDLLTTPRTSDLLDVLNYSEYQVLQALAQGMENSAIAEDLFLSVKAVENHVSRIFRKLDLTEEPGVNRRVRAALAYERSRGRPTLPRR